MFKKKHGRNHLSNYLDIHRQILANYQEGQEAPKIYTEKLITENYLELEVEDFKILTKKGNWIKVKIHKDVEIDRSGKIPTAKTFTYSYHARYADSKIGGNIIRYCSEHGHRPYHHKHIYKQDGSFDVLKIQEDEFPHVNEFLDELIENF